VGAFLRQFDRYRAAVKWLITRVYKHFKGHLLLVLLGQWSGLAISAVAILLLVTLVRKLESGHAFEVMSWQLPLTDSYFLTLAVALILLVMSLGVLLLYRAKRGAVTLAARFSLACAADITHGFGFFAPSSAAYVDDKRLHTEIMRLMNSDSRHAGMALRRLVEAKLAALVFILGTALLFYLHWQATVGVLLTALAALPFYYRVNQMAAHATKRFEEMGVLARQDCMRGLAEQKRVNSWQPSRFPQDAQGYPGLQSLVEAHRDRFIALTQSELISRMLLVLVVAALALGVGHFTSEGEIPWLLVLSYLLVLRFVMLAVRQINQAFTSISRFYPSLYRLTQYFSALDATSQALQLDSLFLRVRRISVTEKLKRKKLQPGCLVNIHLPVELSRLSVGLLGRALGMKSPAEQRSFIEMSALVGGFSEPPVTASLHSYLQLPDGLGAVALADLTGLPVIELAEAFGAELQRVPDSTVLQSRNAEWWGRLLLASAWLTEKPIVVINLDAPGLGQAFASMREKFADRRVLLCTQRSGKLSLDYCVPEVTAVVAADGAIVALGSALWVQENWKTIAEIKRRVDKRLLAAKSAQGLEDSFEE